MRTNELNSSWRALFEASPPLSIAGGGPARVALICSLCDFTFVETVSFNQRVFALSCSRTGVYLTKYCD